MGMSHAPPLRRTSTTAARRPAVVFGWEVGDAVPGGDQASLRQEVWRGPRWSNRWVQHDGRRQVRKSIFNKSHPAPNLGRANNMRFGGGGESSGLGMHMPFRANVFFLRDRATSWAANGSPGGSQPRRFEETNGSIRPLRGEGEEGVRCHDARGG